MKLKVSDLVMLKTEPRFHLDRYYKGPFVIRSLSTTNADIQLKDDPAAEILNVSRQCLSLCNVYMSQSIPWLGHSGKLRKRRRVHQRKKREPATTSNPGGLESQTHDVGVDKPSTSNYEVPKATRSGRQVKAPARFLHLNKPAGRFTKRREVVRPNSITDDRDHVRRDVRKI